MDRESFVELNARERAKEVMDGGSFRELIDPFDQLESPHLAAQSIIPQSDDGVVIARGKIDGEPAVVISIEGNFQGGGIGEVSGAKIAGALELALRDHENGISTRPVILFDTGGVRLQEANYGLLAVSEIQAALVALRRYVPVVGVIPGKVGCFGGMSITAALFSHLIMTREGRFGLNGPEVIEQEAGIEEFDARDKQLIWGTIGGEQRHATGFVDTLIEDDINTIKKAIRSSFTDEVKEQGRTVQVDRYLSLLKQVDPTQPLSSHDFRGLWLKVRDGEGDNAQASIDLLEKTNISDSRGRTWFQALSDIKNSTSEGTSVLCEDAILGDEQVRYISVVPNSNSRFPRARHGEVGLEEGWTIAKYVRQAIEEDKDGVRRPIVAIVDVPSQAYGYQEELLGIHYACAAAVDAYATARLEGHPVITLIVGKAISGAFLAHGYQSNRILALNDEGVNVHAMSKQSAARITRRTMEQLEEATKKIPAMAYDIQSFARLGVLHELIDGVNAERPSVSDVQLIKEKLSLAIKDARNSSRDLSHRLLSDEAVGGGRTASINVRKKLAEQWI